MPRIERPRFVLRLDLLPLRVPCRFALRASRRFDLMAFTARAFVRFKLFAVLVLSGLEVPDVSGIGRWFIPRAIAVRHIGEAPAFDFRRQLLMRMLLHLAHRLFPFRMMFVRPGRIPLRPPAHWMPTMLAVVVAEPFGVMIVAPPGMTLPPPTGFRFFGELSRAGKIASAQLVVRRPCSRSKIGGSGLLSSLGNANGAMVGLILRLSIAAESFTSYVQLSEEALAGAVTGNAPPRRLASLPTALSRLLITNFEKQPV
jgi:hypothetical protein